VQIAAGTRFGGLSFASNTMIFGFNTDVKHCDTVYHVQTEAHRSNHTFQSTVFVKGQCVAKKTGSYAEASDAEQTDQQLHELLKEQHRQIVEAIRNGQIGELATATSEPPSDFL
jgi:DNA-binding FadR family transcriptional regulator